MSSSYLEKSLRFKILKVARYLRLYGPSRTLVKVRSQVHMTRRSGFVEPRWRNPKCINEDHKNRIVAIIGCGNFAYSSLAYYLRRADNYFLRGTYDTENARARSLCADYGGIYAAADPQAIIEDNKVELVYIASNHASHAEYAIACIKAGKHVHIEKPHVVTEEQSLRLRAAQESNPNAMVFLGFNRPKSRHFKQVKAVLEGQRGPQMINWFLAGHEIPPDHWYFSEAEGGRVLGNLCHWTDLTLEMVGLENAFPCEIVPATAPNAKSDFCLGIVFKDQSVAGLTFSAKGHTFEGVREVLNVHRGDALVQMNDFHRTEVDVVDRKRTYRTIFRDHGHGENIQNSYRAVLKGDLASAVSPGYAHATAALFLGARRAIESNQRIQVLLDK